MKRRKFISTTTGFVMGTALASLAAKSDRRKPNVVIMNIDDLGYGDLECFGNDRGIPTPNIDRLAREGVRCTMSYITNPPCSPSRCCLITGMYPQRFGKSGMARGLPIPEDHPTLAEFMREAGYATGQIGKWDIGAPDQGPQKRGFSEVARYAPGTRYNCHLPDGSITYRTDLDARYMVEFVERNKGKPFFLYFSPNAIHSSLRRTPQRYMDRVEGDHKWYKGAIVAVDDAVGRLLKTLDENGLTDNTLIILDGDNGANVKNGGSSEPYRGGKLKGNTQYEGWVHTPTIYSWPGTIPAGGVCDGLTGNVDFYATVAAAIGKQPPQRCDGVNLLPYLKGEKSGDPHEFLFWHNADPNDLKIRHLQAVRWKKWRLVKRPDGWHLYDIVNDPKETRNMAAEHEKVVETMMAPYNEWVNTLPPPEKVPDFKGKAQNRYGWGWMINGKGGVETNKRGKMH